MGNCQAILDAVVIQHTDGRVERLYWPMSAIDVMKANPGHHVALVTLSYSEEKDGAAAMKVNRVRLLKSKEVLLLGHVYRLITFQGDEGGEGSAEEQCRDGEQRSAMATVIAEHLRVGRLTILLEVIYE